MIIISSFLAFLFACSPNDGTNDHGTELEESLPVPKVLKEVTKKAPTALKNGLRTKWFANGKKSQEAEYSDGKKNGLFRAWYENGQLAKEGSMKNDKWNGPYLEWREDGIIRVEGYYVDGVQDGEWKFFDSNGKPLPVVTFSLGKEVTRELPRFGF